MEQTKKIFLNDLAENSVIEVSGIPLLVQRNEGSGDNELIGRVMDI